MTHKDVQFPRENDRQICYLKNCITRPNIEVGDYTIYHDFEDPLAFERRNVLYHYPINKDKLTIGRFCSIAHGTRFIFNGANHTLGSLSTYPFAVMRTEWDLDCPVTAAWDHKGDITVGHDVWIGFEAVILAGVTIGHGAIVASRAVVKRDVEPYTIVGGIPARPIRKRYPDDQIRRLLELQWWNWDEQTLQARLGAILNGDFEGLMAGPKGER